MAPTSYGMIRTLELNSRWAPTSYGMIRTLELNSRFNLAPALPTLQPGLFLSSEFVRWAGCIRGRSGGGSIRRVPLTPPARFGLYPLGLCKSKIARAVTKEHCQSFA